ncbi:probetacellulin [Ornithorhynchus anatinus]|nr:probetacellulin [Ornithorhynchus anatinus]
MDPAVPAPSPGPLPMLLALALGFVIFNCVRADGHSTTGQGLENLVYSQPGGNCSENITQSRRRGHFSRCPKQYKHYCIKGKCRYVVAEQTPACVCETGYSGARCERADLFYLRGDRGQIVVICLIAAMMTVIILVICICSCSHPFRKRRKRRKQEEMDTLDKESAPKPEGTDEVDTDIA